MGNTHSTQQPLTQQPPTRERLILSNVENGYYNPNVKSNKKNDRQSSLLPYVPYKPKQTNKKQPKCWKFNKIHKLQ